MLTAAEVVAAEYQTVTSGTPVVELMERAGAAVFQEIVDRYEPMPIQVLCGPGNNGGDGYVVARLLRQAGWDVSVLAPSGVNPAHSAELWHGETLPLKPDSLKSGALMVDALFGIGLQRDLDESYGLVVERMNALASHIVSVDLPSGVQSDTGRVMGYAAKADLTVSFNFRKRGHVLQPGVERCGLLVVRDIGLRRAEDTPRMVYVNHPSLWQHLFSIPSPLSHKYTRGYVNILGGAEMTGAARLVAMAARRMGAGMTRIESLPSAYELYRAQCLGTLTKSITKPEEFTEEPRLTAAVIGPGAGRSLFTRDVVLNWLQTGKPAVIDADALYVFKDEPQELFLRLHNDIVLMPHAGEFDYLFNTMGDKIERAQFAAKHSGAIVLLKGSDTVIAHPSGLTLVQDISCPFLATGGTGDILAGMIGALLSQGMPSIAAAACASYVHVKAAQHIGLGLIAEDIPDRIPEILKSVLLGD